MSEQSTPALTSQQVEYRPIPWAEGYRVGDDGSVWSCRNRNGSGLTSVWRQLRLTYATGYASVSLRRDGAKQPWAVHHLVLEAFVGPRPEGLLALHKDDDRTNNRPSNLYWGTYLDNARDRRTNGRERPAVGNALPGAKLTEEKVIEARRLRRQGVSSSEIARRLDVSLAAILLACRGTNWKHVAEPTSPTRRATVARQTHCLHGHPMEGDNLRVTKKGHHQCRACDRAKKAAAKLRDPDGFRQKANERARAWYARRKLSPVIRDVKDLETILRSEGAI